MKAKNPALWVGVCNLKEEKCMSCLKVLSYFETSFRDEKRSKLILILLC